MTKIIVCSDYWTEEHKQNMGYLVQLLERGKAFKVEQKCMDTNGAIAYIVTTSTDTVDVLLDDMSVTDMLPIEDVADLATAMVTLEERGFTADTYRPLPEDNIFDVMAM